MFDFESTTDNQLANGDFDHVVNFVAVHIFCPNCITSQYWNQRMSDCEICGDHRFLCFSPFPFQTDVGADKTVITDDPLTEFVRWLLYETPKAYPSVCFSHYGGIFT